MNGKQFQEMRRRPAKSFCRREIHRAAQYDVSNDGSRLLINTIVVPPTPPNLYVIVNWKPPAPQK